MNWRDLDLDAGTLTVRASKTPAGREVDLPSGLVTDLWNVKQPPAHRPTPTTRFSSGPSERGRRRPTSPVPSSQVRDQARQRQAGGAGHHPDQRAGIAALCDGPMPHCATPVETIRSTLQSRVAGKTQRSQCGSTPRASGAGRSCQATVEKPLTRPLIGHPWALRPNLYPPSRPRQAPAQRRKRLHRAESLLVRPPSSIGRAPDL